MRGEYIHFAVLSLLHLGSPPLARGILTQCFHPPSQSRITPACAGNTSFFPSESPWLQDHPRLRGEYGRMTIRNHFTQGSPPLARGIQQQAHMGTQYHGITPACAGNTQSLQGKKKRGWDHPRLRGEYTKKIPYLQPFPNLHI